MQRGDETVGEGLSTWSSPACESRKGLIDELRETMGEVRDFVGLHPHLSQFAKTNRAPVLLPQAGEDGNPSFSAVLKVTKAIRLKLRPEAA